MCEDEACFVGCNRAHLSVSCPVSHPEHVRQDPVQRPAVPAVCHPTGQALAALLALCVCVSVCSHVCPVLQNVLRKVQHQDALQISDVVMASLLRMFQSTAGSGGVQEDALMAVSTLVEGEGLQTFERWTALASCQSESRAEQSFLLHT